MPPLIAEQRALQIASAQGVPGTVAALVHDHQGNLCLLSNHHVLFGGATSIGDLVWAIPPNHGFDTNLPVCLGKVHSGQLGRVCSQQDTFFIDGALVHLGDMSQFPSWLGRRINDSWPSQTINAEPGMRIYKNGPSTGLTMGRVVDVSYPDWPFISGRSWDAPGQLLVESLDPELNFAAPGDSGAAIVDEAGRLTGLLWGTNETGAGIASPIEPVLEYLQVSLVHGALLPRIA
jgi:hypothetical protein